MVDEASKTQRLRGPDFARQYFAGRVLDIGAGQDPVCPHAERFDAEDGDANRILDFLEAAAYDTVHSSHCLEHMRRPPQALAQWWELIKPGGHLVLVVPDEDLYEQGIWPSLFNPDHKATFRLDTDLSWSPVSYEARSLVAALPGARILSAERHDRHYDYALMARPRRAVAASDPRGAPLVPALPEDAGTAAARLPPPGRPAGALPGHPRGPNAGACAGADSGNCPEAGMSCILATLQPILCFTEPLAYYDFANREQIA